MKRFTPRLALLAVALAPVAAGAQAKPAARAATRTATTTPVGPLAASFDTAALSAVRWREIGPYRGGRSVAVAGSVARPKEYWMGTVGAGVMKSTDGGDSWAPMTDQYFGGTVGAIAVAPSNPDVVYVGGGEFAIRGNVSHGDGMWKTADGGKTWTNIGLNDTRQISKGARAPHQPRARVCRGVRACVGAE
ncbi:WD40/YVTN/BNR-like repeat-containing protein [Gemmatimonas sp.]|uniref:WD40/YVTN/BNR-like repeat-containing protein n=1 Tax=Gemmatimonas sp. TaxID=1962908 RepID=UPI003DA325AE